MKTSISPLLLLAATGICVGCQSEPPVSPELPFGPSVKSASAGSRSMVPVLTFVDPEGEAVGTSKLVRNRNGVSVKLSTSGLEPGTAATLWIVVFNEPENCSAPGCGEDDLSEAGPVVDVMYAAGSMVGRDGRATFAGHRAEGDNSQSLWAALGLASPGLIDSREAEIHFVVRSHGPLIPKLIRDMTSTFNGGCDNTGLPDDPVIGPPGPNTCQDMQFAVHTP